MNGLSDAAVAQAKAAYQDLYRKALPGSGGIDASRLEVAHFNCSRTFEEFATVGLGLETVVIYRAEDGSGHTGKILLNLPGQLLLEHCHVDTIVLKKDSTPAVGFRPLREWVNGFTGIKWYTADARVARDAEGHERYRYRDDAFLIVQGETGSESYPDDRLEDVVEIFPGKSETFKAVYGDGILFADSAEVLYAPAGVNPESVPESLRALVDQVRAEQMITTQRTIYMSQGMNVLLPKNTRHAFLGGLRGCVYLEFSTPSMDEADRFTDPRVIR